MWAARQRHREGGRGDGPLLAIAAMFFAEFTDVLPLSVSMKEVSMKQAASKYPFYILMYMIFHLFRFIYFLKLKKNMENIFQYLNFCTPNFIMGTMSSTQARENGSQNSFLSRVRSAAKRECEP